MTMKLVGLISGGKDGVFNMLQCIAAGHEIVAVANVEPIGYNKDELDSYMYQTVGHQTLSMLSSAISLPIYRQKTKGVAICKKKVYVETLNDEVEDLYALLYKIKDEMHIDGVSVGAIASDYQRTRVENVCMRLNLKCFAYLWRRDQQELLQEIINADVNAIIVKVAALGLKPEAHLGASIKDLQPLLLDLSNKFGINICGEGGEYETLTIDCPLYHRKIDIIKSEKIIHSDDAFAPVGLLRIKTAVLEPKPLNDEKSPPSSQSRIDYIKSIVKSPMNYIEDCLDDVNSKLLAEARKISGAAALEVLPFPFGSGSSVNEPAKDTDAPLVESWKTKPPNHPQSTNAVTFSPSSLLTVDTSMAQRNHSTGWCCIGNVTAPNIKDGLACVRKNLERYQYELRDVVSVMLYVKDLNEWTTINKIYSQYFSNYCPPTRACVEVPLFNETGVTITVIAHRLVSKTQKVIHHTVHTVDKDFIHVQSISHWAPANIGPYSQCLRVGEIVYVAGQIPLIPGTMELLNGSVVQQCRLTLRHVLRIVKAANEYDMSNVFQGICFVNSTETAAEVSGLWRYITKNDHAAIAILVVSGLPKQATLEWQVIACGYEHPEAISIAETIGEFSVKFKRCVYVSNYTSSLVCNVRYAKSNSSKKDKGLKTFTPENIINVMKECIQQLRGQIEGSGTPLCMFNIFYKASEAALSSVINENFKTSFDFKVVITSIPVLACCEPEVFLTITGICH